MILLTPRHYELDPSDLPTEIVVQKAPTMVVQSLPSIIGAEVEDEL